VPTTPWSHDFEEATALAAAPQFISSLPEAPYGESAVLHPAPVRSGKRKMGCGAPAQTMWHRLPGLVRHVFTHFPLELAVYVADLPAGTPAPPGTRWAPVAQLAGEALPNVMRKVVAHAVANRCQRPLPPILN